MEKEKNNLFIGILILLLLLSGYFGYKYYSTKNNQDTELNNAFSLGYNKSLVDVAQGQAQTGTIIVWVNETIKVISIESICGGLTNG